jgi:hypothetical protein
MSTQYRLVQSGKTASGGCSATKVLQSCIATDYYYYYCIFLVVEEFYKALGTDLKCRIYRQIARKVFVVRQFLF